MNMNKTNLSSVTILISHGVLLKNDVEEYQTEACHQTLHLEEYIAILTLASPIMSVDINVPIRSALVLEKNHFVSVVSLV